MTAAVVSICAVCTRCSAAITALQGGGKTTLASATNTANTSSAPKATNTVKPTNTPDLFAEYRAVVITDSAKLSTALTDMSEPCQAADVDGRRDGAKEVNDTVHAFQSDLDKQPAPACLKTTDSHLRAALAPFESGSQNAMDGIDNSDTDLVSQGTSDITAAGKELTKATDAMKAAKC